MTKVGLRANRRAVAAWLAVPALTAVLLWIMVWLIVQTACYQGSIRV